ncbi:hypothetical protein FKM82_004826 [Ascaphus truei]
MRKSEVMAIESVACFNSALSRLRDIWEEIGIPEDQRLQRTEVVKKHVKGLLDMMITEEESLRERLLKSIDICRKELNTLCLELHLSPFEEEDDSTILQLEKDLRTRVEVLLKQKKERVQGLKILKERDQDLCDILCTAPYHIEMDSVPSLEELDQFRRHLAGLSAEKERRRAAFVSTKKQIVLCMEELDQLPDTSFERDVVCEDEDAFCLSTENLAALNQLLFQLEEQKTKNEVLCEELRSQITELWDRLQVAEAEREAFAVYMTGSKGKIIKALQDELNRLQELKLQNIKQIVDVIRTELTSYWEKCFYSTEQREAFSPFSDDGYNEDLLCLHDAEIGRMKHYYEVHKEMFEGVQKWEENWRLFLEFDLEEELKVRIAGWEQEQQKEFFVNGKKFMDYVTEQWDSLHQEKEKEKQERLLKKNRQLEEEMFYGSTPKTPSKRRVLGATTPGKIRKPGPSSRTPSKVFKTPQSRLLEKNKENMPQLNRTAMSGGCFLTIPAQRNISVNSVASTYSEFARELSKATRSNTDARILNSTITNMPS